MIIKSSSSCNKQISTSHNSYQTHGTLPHEIIVFIDHVITTNRTNFEIVRNYKIEELDYRKHSENQHDLDCFDQ